MALGKLPVPGRPTIWMIVGQGPVALAVGAGGGSLDIFTLLYPFSHLSPSLWETARYRLKYCLKGPLNPKQPTTSSVSCSLLRWLTMGNRCGNGGYSYRTVPPTGTNSFFKIGRILQKKAECN